MRHKMKLVARPTLPDRFSPSWQGKDPSHAMGKKPCDDTPNVPRARWHATRCLIISARITKHMPHVARSVFRAFSSARPSHAKRKKACDDSPNVPRRSFVARSGPKCCPVTFPNQLGALWPAHATRCTMGCAHVGLRTPTHCARKKARDDPQTCLRCEHDCRTLPNWCARSCLCLPYFIPL